MNAFSLLVTRRVVPPMNVWAYNDGFFGIISAKRSLRLNDGFKHLGVSSHPDVILTLTDIFSIISDSIKGV